MQNLHFTWHEYLQDKSNFELSLKMKIVLPQSDVVEKWTQIPP